MKCSNCGTENNKEASQCRTCGKKLINLRQYASKMGDAPTPVRTLETKGAATRRPTASSTFDHRTIPDKFKSEYSHGVKDQTQRSLEGIQSLLHHIQGPDIDVDKLLNDAADLIWRQFGIDNVAIGLRDPKDGLYKYRAMVGFRPDAMEAHKRIAYKKEQFFGDEEFHGAAISKYSRMYLAEDNILTEEEKAAYNRPGLLKMKRASPTDSLEGDYFDIGIYDPKDELEGWIEISGTRLLKLPDVTTIKWIEVIGMIVGLALVCAKSP